MLNALIHFEYLPVLAILSSLLVVPLIFLSSRLPFLREFWTVIAAFLKFFIVLLMLPKALQGVSTQITLLELSPQVSFALRADPLGVYFALIASFLWIITSFYSIGYMRGAHEKNQTRYFASFALCLSTTIGVAFSANLLTFLVFYEALTLATYPLVIHKESPEAIASGRKYLIYTLTAGVLLIAATVIVYMTSQHLNFVPNGFITSALFSPWLLKVVFLMFFIGVGVKAGVMPFHSWLPAAMVAPTPVSALLHAVAVVKSGVFGLMRITQYVFGPTVMLENQLNLIVIGFATVTILLASLLAFRQNNLKKRLAYSTVAHLSYIVLGLGLVSASAFTGSLLHMAFHATMKITLFFAAGAIYVMSHKTEISELDGIGRLMPWTMGAFTIGALGLAGIPPINGFLSKWYLGLGGVESGHLFVLIVLGLSGLMNAGYLLPIVYRAFFKAPSADSHVTEAPNIILIPILFVASLSLVLGVFANFGFGFFDLAQVIQKSIFR